MNVAPDDQFFDQQAGHNGFTGTGIVGKEKSQRLAIQHFAVDTGDLMRQWLDQGGMYRKHGVEEIGQANSMGLRDQAKQCALTLEAP